jgi:hypothetical protein
MAVLGGGEAAGRRRAPYVPAAWRQAIGHSVTEVPVNVVESPTPVPTNGEAALTPVSSMPWIDAFLASTPAMPMPAIAEPVEESDTESEAVHEEPSEHWPLDEAAEGFRTYSNFPRESSAADEDMVPPAARLKPMPAWSDDDFLEIMPVGGGIGPAQAPSVGGSDGELWSERARRAQEEAMVLSAMARQDSPQANAADAAKAFEVLARRVRAGELVLPGYDPRMGEPAALVAALAALLGVRLR